jgi:hypothetical protein
MTIFVEGAKTRLSVQKTRKDKKVTGSQDDDSVGVLKKNIPNRLALMN